jgi:aspartate kinase
MKHGVRLQVLSSFENTAGTLVVDEDEIVEKAVVSGIAYSRDEAKITLVRVPDQPGVAAAINRAWRRPSSARSPMPPSMWT